MKKLIMALSFAAAALGSQSAMANRDHIMIVGSSTVFPFSKVVAERFALKTQQKAPKVEPTGTGGGFMEFCKGVGVTTPDIANASRAIKASEFASCQANGVKDIVEVLIGYDGIVIANSNRAPQLALSLRDIFLALAKVVPDPAGGETLVDNPYKTWKQVNPSLPDLAISVMGPPPTSGTRDAFVELAMEGGCNSVPWIKSLAKSNKDRFKAICHGIREDGAFIEAGENDNLIVRKLEENPRAVGIFGFSFLEQNADKVQAATVDGVAPNFDTIADNDYIVSRPLFFYVKKAHIGVVPGIQEFLSEFTSEDAMGEFGYLADKGMIALDPTKAKQVRDDVQALNPLSL